MGSTSAVWLCCTSRQQARAAFIVHDVQLLAGGKHAHSVALSPDDYIVGAITVYLDVVNLFVHLLQIISELTRER